MHFRAQERRFALFEESAMSEGKFLALQSALNAITTSSHTHNSLDAYSELRFRLPELSNASL